MQNEPATPVTEIMKPAYDAIDTALVRCRELAERLEVLAGPDVTTALLAYAQAAEDLSKVYDSLPSGGYKDASEELKEQFGRASLAENAALRRLRALACAIRQARAEKAAAAE